MNGTLAARIIGISLVTAIVTSGCGHAMQIDAPKTLPALNGTNCFTRAATAADQEYKKYYKADWYINLTATVQANQVRSVEVRVGPYDGSAGGGVVAQYDCAEGRLVTLEYER